MAGRALHFTALGPLEPNSRASLGLEIQGTGMPGRPVVLIALPPEITKDPARLAEVQARTQSAARLNHPNVIRVIGLEQLEDGWTRIVEYADAESLRRLLAESAGHPERPPPSVAAAILADACLGVHHAHELGEATDGARPQVHGGIRPATLLVTHSGHTKITGYGASVFAPLGKAALHPYLAPEQVLGGVEAMTRGTDVYALGAVLYELLAGCPPFAPDEGPIDNLILTMRPQAMRVADEPELAEIALKALSKKAADRYPTALAMREALMACRLAAPASPEVVVRWLDGLIPPTHPDRVARRALLDSALATTGAVTLPHDSVLPISAPSLVPAPPAPAPAPPAPEVAKAATPPPAAPKPVRKAFSESSIVPYEPSFSERVEIRASSSRRSAMIAGVIGGSIIGGLVFVYWRNQVEPEPPPARPPSAPFLAGIGTRGNPPTPIPTPPVVDGGLPTPGGSPGAPAVAAVVDAGPHMYVMDLSTDPPMDIRVDGKVVGREEVRISLAEGIHHVEASDHPTRTYTSREVDLRKDHQKVDMVVGTSELAFDVPVGSTVTLDGKELGKAPVQPVTLYAGSHEVVVDLDGATTTKNVQMHADQNLTLTVHHD